jgi:Flp pilus assembly protein TadG
MRLRTKAKGKGQVVVEMLLILPVFLTIVFSIMEMGHLAFWVIVLNHATYECARIGAMEATRQDGSGPRDVTAEMQGVMSRIIQTARIDPATHTEPTLTDPQANVQNNDLVVVGTYNAHLIFPISNLILASPKGSGIRRLTAVVRMPIEQPLPR